MDARYGGPCADCGAEIAKGERIVWFRLTKEAIHATCPNGYSAPGDDYAGNGDAEPPPSAVDQILAGAARHFYGDSPEVERVIAQEREERSA
jgi:hypothetical protein